MQRQHLLTPVRVQNSQHAAFGVGLGAGLGVGLCKDRPGRAQNAQQQEQQRRGERTAGQGHGNLLVQAVSIGPGYLILRLRVHP